MNKQRNISANMRKSWMNIIMKDQKKNKKNSQRNAQGNNKKNSQKNNRILIFCSREICYYSADFFAAQIADELEKKGFQVIMQVVDVRKDLDQQLTRYVGEEYFAILDFNSLLPRMELEEGKRYLDSIKAPFFNYIVDHPLYHHPGLTIELENYHAIGIDEDHCSYMKKYYPNIKSVPMIPLGATKALYEIPFEEKKEEILFIGTYQASNQIYQNIKNEENTKVKKDILNLIDILLSDEKISHEAAMKKLLKEKEMSLTDEEMPKYMNLLYECDRYIRNYLREQAVYTLIENEIPVTVVGNGWGKCPMQKNQFLHILEPVDFSMSFQKIAQYAVTLNVSPVFRAGAHDRIFAAMANNSVSLTDTNRYMTKNFQDQKEICLFSFHQKEAFVENAKKLLDNPCLRIQMAKKAATHFEQSLSWEIRTNQLLEAIETSYKM